MEPVGEGEDGASFADEANLAFLSRGKQDIF